MGRVTTTYSHAAPYIRHSILNTASLKLGAQRERDKSRLSGEMFGYIAALKILLASPEGADSPVGYPEFRGRPEAVAEVTRFVGGEHEMQVLGFIE